MLLELALQRYALDVLMREGFTPTITPDLARNEILQGTGYIPRGPETQIYSIADTDLSLVATAEITLGGLLSGEILDPAKLPIKLCGISHCYRTEAGAGGRAARGLYRVHQFTKVEMFAFTLPEQSEAMLDYFCDLECRLFDGLGIAYRVVDTATGDLGGPAYRKFDLEAWMPGRGDQGEYGEVTSTSNCTDYQARRLGIRYRTGEKGTAFVHTLNGTAIAISRALIAMLENYQQADGSVVVPEVLRSWVGRDRISSSYAPWDGSPPRITPLSTSRRPPGRGATTNPHLASGRVRLPSADSASCRETYVSGSRAGRAGDGARGRRPDDYEPKELEMLVNVVLVFVPSDWIDTRHTTMINASMTAYSTAVGPSSQARNRCSFLSRNIGSSFRA